MEWNGSDDTFAIIVIAILAALVAFTSYIENLLFPEETSNRKIISRCIITGIAIMAIYIISNFIPSLECVLSFGNHTIGYFFTSILFKTVFYDESYIEVKKKSE